MHVHVHMYVRTYANSSRATYHSNNKWVLGVSNLASTSILLQRMVSKLACNYNGLARSSPLQIHPYFSYFSTLQSRLRLSAVNSNKHSLSLKPHPSINLGMRILKSPILGNSEFAKYNACQIFPLYGIQEMDFMNVPLSMVHYDVPVCHVLLTHSAEMVG